MLHQDAPQHRPQGSPRRQLHRASARSTVGSPKGAQHPLSTLWAPQGVLQPTQPGAGKDHTAMGS